MWCMPLSTPLLFIVNEPTTFVKVAATSKQGWHAM